jgi:hypothetical protein
MTIHTRAFSADVIEAARRTGMLLRIPIAS